MTEQLPPGTHGWISATCLGCAAEVLEADRHLIIGGRRDGSYLIEIPSWQGGRARSTNPDMNLTLAGAEALGAAHPKCGDVARFNITHGLATFADALPELFGEDPARDN